MSVARDRVRRIFEFLRELHQVRNPVTRQIDEQPWLLWFRDLPIHGSIRRGAVREAPDDDQGEGADDGYLLKVRRPRLSPPPSPPERIRDWLEAEWDDPFKDVRVRDSLGESVLDGQWHEMRFADDASRLRLFETWRRQREQWVVQERPAREAMRIFERLYELRGRIAREAERVELMLGDGILSIRLPDGGVYHPVLLQRVQLEFDPAIPEFAVVETEDQPELYSPLLRLIPEADAQEIATLREELAGGGYHPLGCDDTAGFLRSLVQRLGARGEYVGEGGSRGESDSPKLGREPVLFLRRRTQGFGRAIEGILEDLPTRADLPPPLVNIVGIEGQARSGMEPRRPRLPGDELEEILFSKPWNDEQLRIAERLHHSGAVLVQGPPGTGKSHTIANLIGHLLAQGKSILVTAHTAKALRVLRDFIVRELQPLCVSVLESDLESRRQLEASVQGITTYLSEYGADELEAKARSLATERRQLLAKIQDLRTRILDARGAEYRDVVVAGQGYPPAEAARRVAVGRGRDDWIPGPLAQGAPMPLSPSELGEVYRLNISVTREDEAELGSNLPEIKSLERPEGFERLVEECNRLSAADRERRRDLWTAEPGTEGANELALLRDEFQGAARAIDRDTEEWRLAVTLAGLRGGPEKDVWENLVALIQGVEDRARQSRETLLRHDPRLSPSSNPASQKQILEEILLAVGEQTSLPAWSLWFRPRWRQFVRETWVAGERPRLRGHFEALLEIASLEVARGELRGRWDRQMATLGAAPSADLGADPEQRAFQFVPLIRAALQWGMKIWQPLVARLLSHGFSWASLLTEQAPDLSAYGELRRLHRIASEILPPILTSRVDAIQWFRNQQRIGALLDRLSDEAMGRTSDVGQRLREAVANLDPEAYQEAFDRLVRLSDLRINARRRDELLARLKTSASGWAEAIKSRRGIHGQGELPGDPTAAWLWRQLHDELATRNAVSIQALQDELLRTTDTLRSVTAKLIDKRAWASQIRKTGLRQQQALMGWLNTVKKIGRGYGKKAAQLRAEAARLMSECRTAVPVWIMPLSRVAESFDPRAARFDVVIIDEASQSDAMALIAIYMAGDVVVVGDHEQVSPEAVGEQVELVGRLVDEYLKGIPNAILYDGRRSIYDIAMESFGGAVMLLEHFRCVPDIIQFSNWLSYNGRIRPLREWAGVKARPHVVPYRVRGRARQGKVNREEAAAVASLLVASAEMPEYVGKTFGVVSLVGEEQAIEIEKLVRSQLLPDEYEKRRILCGTAAQFQGDERDVMFLSVVDVAADGPLPLRQEDRFKQRFNVAASRARDQMWVVYSLDSGRDLKSGDLRRRLIEHALEPQAVSRMLASEERRAASELERAVMRRLVEKGYRVRSQHPAGYYRIDLVVESKGERLAVECDGDRYHPIEKLPEDLDRQMVLERLGWKFARIRGSEFYQDPDMAMKPVFERLRQLGIEPEGPDVAESLVELEALRDRIVRRAEELRRTLAEQEGVWGLTEPPSTGGPLVAPRELGLPERPHGPPEPQGGEESPPKEPRPEPPPAAPLAAPGRTTPENQENLQEWVAALGAELWFRLAHWAKEHDQFGPKARKFLFSMGRHVAKGWELSHRQGRWARSLYEDALRLGFDPTERSSA